MISWRKLSRHILLSALRAEIRSLQTTIKEGFATMSKEMDDANAAVAGLVSQVTVLVGEVQTAVSDLGDLTAQIAGQSPSGLEALTAQINAQTAKLKTVSDALAAALPAPVAVAPAPAPAPVVQPAAPAPAPATDAAPAAPAPVAPAPQPSVDQAAPAPVNVAAPVAAPAAPVATDQTANATVAASAPAPAPAPATPSA